MPCPISPDKIRFQDELQARMAIVNIKLKVFKRNLNREKLPERAYSCRACKGWHITSQKQKTEVKV